LLLEAEKKAVNADSCSEISRLRALLFSYYVFCVFQWDISVKRQTNLMHIGGNNVYEEFIDKLKKRKEERQEDYNRLKGMIAGFRLTNFNQTEESLVLIVEYAMNSFKDHQDSIDALKEATIYSFQRLETLEKEMKRLRENSVRFRKKRKEAKA
jgi:hypothetical protein